MFIEFKNVIQLDPQDAMAHYELGRVYLKLKNIRGAFQSFKQATELKPEHYNAQLQLGNIYLLSKKTRKPGKRRNLF